MLSAVHGCKAPDGQGGIVSIQPQVVAMTPQDIYASEPFLDAKRL